MKNNRFYSLLAVLLMASMPLLGGTVDVERAKALGAKFVEANFKNDTQLEWVYTGVSEKGHPAFYAFNGTSGGFVIISASDLTSPILGYAETGNFNTENIPDGLSYFLNGYGQSVDFAEENLKKADFVIAQEWENLERSGKTQTLKSVVVQPLIATHWDQDCFYNAFCPKDEAGPCGNAYAGCVATSMAQVMKYWNHPQQGTGSHSYNSYLYGTQYADFGATTYHWDEMPESLNDDNQYVSLLMYHCGVSVDMNYGSMASGALHQSIPPAMSSYFGYGTSHNLFRDDYPYDEWVAMMRDALDMGIPILYAGTDGGSQGHSFICDGYDDNGLFHINWSWGGELDGWFSIDNLQTYNQSWNLVQKMIADAVPSGVYNAMPKAPTNLSVQPLSDDSYTCTVHWNNPTKSLNNSNLTHIDQIVVKRDGRVVYTEYNVTPGAAMEITDEVPFYGLHDYQVYAVNNGLHGQIATESRVRFGPSCSWTIAAGTTFFNGWQGASIQVINNASQVVEAVTAHSSSETISVEVPLGHVAFAWVKGNSTVSDVSFVIRDADNQVVYSYLGNLEGIDEGVFLQMNNSCGNGTDCGAPTDLYAFAEEDRVVLAWTSFDEYANYNVYRDGQLIQTVRDNEATFADESATHGGHCYFVTAFCASGESDPTNEACATIGDDCQPATQLWYEMTNNNKVKLTWGTPQPNDGLSGFYIYRTKEADMNWQQIKTLGANYTSYTDNTSMEDETAYLYKVVAYYQSIDCYSAPARSKYSEYEYFVRVYWSVNGVGEAESVCTEVFPVPGTDRLNIRTALQNAYVEIYDLAGKLVCKKEITENVTSINAESWPSGAYVWKVMEDGKEAEVGKWIKE